jgi:plastocyanin domain-containing protein
MMIIVNLAGVLLICLIVWWFWLHKTEEGDRNTGDLIINVANGTYMPSQIEMPAGKPSKIRFLRMDESPCSEVVVFSEIGVSQELPIGEVTEVALPALAAGDYAFTCQMQMYRGSLSVKEESHE